MAPPGPPRWRRTVYRLLVVPLAVIGIYLVLAGAAYTLHGLAWVIRHA